MAIQESRTVGSMPSTERPSPWAWTLEAAPKKLKPTIRTPVLLRRSRREICDLVSMVGSPSLGFHAGICGALDGADDAEMSAAAADVAVQRSLDVGDRRVRVLVEQSLGAHHHAVHAIAALRRLFLDKRRLDRVRVSDAAQSFERGDALILRRRRREHAGAHGVAIDEHRA